VTVQQFVIKRFELDKVRIVSGLLQAPGTKRAVAHLALFSERSVGSTNRSHRRGRETQRHEICLCNVDDRSYGLRIRLRCERIGSPAIPPQEPLGSSFLQVFPP